MVTAIIPNWNGEARLGDLLNDLAAQTQTVARVLVVDNGSTDGSLAVVQKHGAELIALDNNRGFAHAVNQGIQAAETPLVAILNNDIRISPEWLSVLTAALDADARAAFATGKIYRLKQEEHNERILDGSFDAICRGGCAWRCGNDRPDSELWNHSVRIQMAPLTGAVVRRSLFEELGSLDETFESYLEDVDFGIRCALAGRSGLYVPRAEMEHWGSATLGMWHPETVRRIARNQVYLVAKHYPRKWVIRYGWPVLVAQLLWGVLALRRGALAAWLRGKIEGLYAFGRMRGGSVAPDTFAGVIQSSERTIYDLQRQTGFDPYWKLYFALVGHP
jgi:GT2 family glycosyltransferase